MNTGSRQAASFLAGVLLGLWLIVLTASPAMASQPPSSCDNTLLYVAGHQHANEGNHKGILANVQFYTTPLNACARVSSVLAHVTNHRLVEVGWNLGYDCQGFYHATPVIFIYWETQTLGPNCHTEGENSGFHELKVQDQNADTVWTAYVDGASISTQMDVNFIQGTMLTNGERHNSSDVSASRFWNLKAFTVGSCCYAPFDDLKLWCDTYSSFKFNKVSNTENTVVSGSTSNSCPK
jgi:hypothetical protein